MPLVTIITATFNAAKYLPRTIDSIRAMNYKDTEWIIVDGASSDETVKLIRQNGDVIDHWISEPDKGIYDAWNKGIVLARGEWIAFLGAGDTYESGSIAAYLATIAAAPIRPDLATSRIRLIDNQGAPLRILGDPFDWNVFKKRMTIAHPGALHHRSLFERQGLFDTSYASAADYEFLFRCGARLLTVYLDAITVNMLVGGISQTQKGVLETYRIQKKYGAGIIAEPRYWWTCAKLYIRQALRGY